MGGGVSSHSSTDLESSDLEMTTTQFGRRNTSSHDPMEHHHVIRRGPM
jgi:hypothetical protein